MSAQVGERAVYEITGQAGIGKSRLLRRVLEVAGDSGEGAGGREQGVAVLHVDVSNHSVVRAAGGIAGADVPDLVLQRSFAAYCDFLHVLIRQWPDLPGRRAARLDDEIEMAKRRSLELLASSPFPRPAVQRITMRIKADTVTNAQRVVLPPQEPIPDHYRRGLEGVRHEIDDTVLSALLPDRRKTRPARAMFYLLLDQFEALLGQAHARWILSFAERISPGVAIVAWQHASDSAPEPLCPGSVQHHLKGLNAADVRDYLAQRMNGAIAEELAATVHTFSAGVPQVVGAVRDLVVRRGIADQASLSAELAGVKSPYGGALVQQEVGDLVHRLLDATGDSRLTTALEALSVARSFNLPMMEALLGEDTMPGHDLPAVFGNAVSFSFVTEEPSPGGMSAEYRIHDYLRHELESRLARRNPRRHVELHRRALEHHRACIEDSEPDEELPSAWEWMRYQKTEWQHHRTEWLWHLSLVSRNDRVTAMLDFSRVFLDAFWWDGFLVPTPYCEQLLVDGTVICQTHSDRLWLAQLQRLYDVYPRHVWHDDAAGRDDAAWAAVADALRYVRREARLDGRRARLDSPEHRHLRGLTDQHMAEVARFTGDKDAAERHYRHGIEMFEQNDDKYLAAWVMLELANLYLETGVPDQVNPLLEKAEAAAVEEEDPELLAEVAGAYGDLCWHQGEHESAMDAYARMILHGYVQHVGYSLNLPDAYSDMHYQILLARVGRRLSELRAEPGVFDRTVRRMGALFDPYWARVGGRPTSSAPGHEPGEAALVTWLFPPPPGPEGLSLSSTYPVVALQVRGEMEDLLQQPLTTELPDEYSPRW
ncbi:hypothetical protein [Streptomyces hawaiiensis]|uniref:Tetratricopeptide repeat protein n=1 Tax=Streptomyces hawaiiensis TaxID=67305 RepID=A0A6G5R831_9ACTN|nr:hypothetical protein [Streptomyces hawaiiensis]QCD54248.1 hypothetical protein CEB94_04820 [Streptomyces hawaiiensis]